MNAEIITIGDEILIGQIIDTNSAFIAKALNKIGVSVYQITSIQDDREHILKAFKEAEDNAEIIIVTGGLGPTKDDITKKTICEYTNDQLVENVEVLKHVENIFKRYISTPISNLNRMQALVPSQAEILTNTFGTAPGMWVKRPNNRNIIMLPGVPYEMKALIDNEVIPRLRDRYKFPYIIHRTVLTYGLGESAIAERIEAWEDNLPKTIKLAYLPSLGRVRLRLSGKSLDKKQLEANIENEIKKLLPQIDDIFTGFEEDDTLVSLIAKQFVAKDMTLAIAESCTGGKLSETLTEKAGASTFYKGGLTTYSTHSKIDILGIKESLIETHSVVSKEVAEEMAERVRVLFNSDYGISTTGNAGPSKGDSDAEVGTVYIAIASESGVFSEKFIFGNQREKVIGKSVNKALEMLQKEIFKKR
ncbi:nicotinamide-nucleotide amidase [Flavobacteriaceae bacterium MAR_2010_188]|nr:nicotinamide-nucleotide amidase [Flavobacteriaceae bacterium MAR_2010_188]